VLIILLLGVAGTGVYMYQNHLNPFSLDDINKAKTGILSKGNEITQVITAPDQTGKTTTVYKRKDANGNWYYSNVPPKPGEQAEALTYSSDTNVLPPLPDDKKNKK